MEAAAARERADSVESVAMHAFIAAPDTTKIATSVAADAWAQRTRADVRTAPTFAAIHRVAVRARLDSAERLLAGAAVSDEARAAARLEMEAAVTPLTPRDSVHKAQLKGRLNTLMKRANMERDKAAAEAQRALAAEQVDRRRTYAAELENTYLDKGLNVTVTTKGKGATTLHLKWILVSRVVAHQLSKSDLLGQLRDMGFKRFEISDGYDESWYWTL